jgi:hypothetical protein
VNINLDAGREIAAPSLGVQGLTELCGLLLVIPCALFAWGYLRPRMRLFPGGKRAARTSIRRDVAI